MGRRRGKEEKKKRDWLKRLKTGNEKSKTLSRTLASDARFSIEKHISTTSVCGYAKYLCKSDKQRGRN